MSEDPSHRWQIWNIARNLHKVDIIRLGQIFPTWQELAATDMVNVDFRDISSEIKASPKGSLFREMVFNTKMMSQPWRRFLFAYFNFLTSGSVLMSLAKGRINHAKAILSPELHSQLENTSVLLVGAGGIGCELRRRRRFRRPWRCLTIFTVCSQKYCSYWFWENHRAWPGHDRPFQLESPVLIQEEGCETEQSDGKRCNTFECIIWPTVSIGNFVHCLGCSTNCGCFQS